MLHLLHVMYSVNNPHMLHLLHVVLQCKQPLHVTPLTCCVTVWTTLTWYTSYMLCYSVNNPYMLHLLHVVLQCKQPLPVTPLTCCVTVWTTLTWYTSYMLCYSVNNPHMLHLLHVVFQSVSQCEQYYRLYFSVNNTIDYILVSASITGSISVDAIHYRLCFNANKPYIIPVW